MKVSIILPTYNEAENIGRLIHAIDRAVPYSKEIIVVDDDSPDGTSQVVQDYIKKFHTRSVRILTRIDDRGLTKSIRDGIALSRGEVVAWMDCDFSMPPAVLAQLLREIEKGADIAVGSRFMPGGKTKTVGSRGNDSRLAIVSSTLLNTLTRWIFGFPFYDYTSGFIAVRSSVLHTIPLSGFYGEYCIDFIVRAFRKSYRIKEIPYVCRPRMRGESKTGGSMMQTIRLGIMYLRTILRLLWSSE